MNLQKFTDFKLLHKVDETTQAEFSALVLSSQNPVWSGFQALLVRHSFYAIVSPAIASHSVIINLEPSVGIVQMINGRCLEKRLERGALATVAAGQTSEWSFTTVPERSFLSVQLTPSFVSRIAAQTNLRNVDQTELLHKLGERDLQLEGIGLAFQAEIEAGCPSGKMYSESLALAFTVRLLGTCFAKSESLEKPLGGLSLNKLRQAIDFIKCHLTSDISLIELATSVQMSEHHFARLFKQSTGLAPHQFLIRERLKLAQQLLITGNLSIAEIALRTGFYDQSHLTRHFKRLTGLTPQRFRRTN